LIKALAWGRHCTPPQRFFRIAAHGHDWPVCGVGHAAMPLFLVLSFVNEKHT
jgi:hypothetical protein